MSGPLAESPISHSLTARAPSPAALEVVRYRRASLDRSGEEKSVRAQANELDLESSRQGWVTVGDYGDNNVSGSKTNVVRREFERMLRDINEGRVKPALIVAFDFSRLLRNRRDKRRLEELMDVGVHLFDVRYKIDTRDKMGRVMFALLAEFAIDRAEELAEYQRASNRLRKQEARTRNNGNPGMGYRPVLDERDVFLGYALVPDEARPIRWAVTELLAGRESMTSITAAWNDPHHPHHVKPPNGGRIFHTTTTRKVLTAARLAGCTEVEVEWDEAGKPTKTRFVPNRDGTLPAIISVEELLQVREIARINQLRGRAQGAGWAPARYLLTGTATCSGCGGTLIGMKSSRGAHRYICRWCTTGLSGSRQCSGVSISLPRLDHIVEGATFERLRSGALAELLQATVDVEGVDAIAAKLNHAEQELQEFLALTEQAEELGEAVSPEAYVSFTRGKERRIAQLKAELAATIQDKHAAQIPLLPAELEERVEEVWHELPLEVRRRIVKICWEGIIVLPEQPGSRRDPSLRVTLVPRTQRPKSMSASL